MNQEALREFAKLSSSYSRQMTEAMRNMVKSGQYPIPDEALKDVSKAKGHVAEYLTAFENWRSLRIPS